MFQKKNLIWLYLFSTIALTALFINCSKSEFGVSNASRSVGGTSSVQELTCSPDLDKVGDQCVAKCNAFEARNVMGVCEFTGCSSDKELWSGSCVAKCPVGQSRETSGGCSLGCNTVTSEMVNGQCRTKCTSNQTRNSAGVCVDNCNLATNDLVNGVCRLKCGANQTRNTAGTCVDNCNLATSEMINGQCLTKCPSGQVRSGMTCVANSCSNGAIDPPTCANCGSSKHMDGNTCVSNTRACNPQPANSQNGYQLWSGGAWQSQCLNYNCLTGFDDVNGSCVQACGANQERVNGVCVAACAQDAERVSGVCQIVYRFQDMSIEYDAKIKKTGSGASAVRSILESGNKTLLADRSREATYDEITGSTAIVLENMESTTPVSAVVTECSRKTGGACRTRPVDPSLLLWSFEAGNNTSLFPSGNNWLCVRTGQSVAEKRGIVDCGDPGPVLFMISNSTPVPGSVPPKGTILYENSRGFASGSFKVRATIKNSTTGFESYDGSYGSIEVNIENRLDMHLSTNQSIFEGYGIPIVTTELIGPNGFEDNATLQNPTCSALTSTGVTIPMTKRQYENRWDFGTPKPSTLPAGTTVTVSCSGTIYGGQTASAKMIRTK